MKCYLKDHGVSDTLNNLHWCARHTKQSTHFYFGVSDTLHIFSVIAHHRLMTNKCAVHTSLFTVHILGRKEKIRTNIYRGHTYTHTTHTHTYTHIHTPIHTYTHTHTNTLTHSHTRSLTHTHTHTTNTTDTHTCTHTRKMVPITG